MAVSGGARGGVAEEEGEGAGGFGGAGCGGGYGRAFGGGYAGGYGELGGELVGLVVRFGWVRVDLTTSLAVTERIMFLVWVVMDVAAGELINQWEFMNGIGALTYLSQAS